MRVTTEAAVGPRFHGRAVPDLEFPSSRSPAPKVWPTSWAKVRHVSGPVHDVRATGETQTLSVGAQDVIVEYEVKAALPLANLTSHVSPHALPESVK